MKSKYELRMREYLELGNKYSQAQLIERTKASITTLIYALFIRYPSYLPLLKELKR